MRPARGNRRHRVHLLRPRERAARDPDKDPQVLWDRWKRNLIDRQVRTAHGAERYIRSGRPIFLDAKRETPFPLPFDKDTAVIKRSSSPTGRSRPANGHRRRTFTAALRSRTRRPTEAPTRPFHIEIDRRDPLHVLDSHNMPIVLRELDTVTDFSVRGGFDEADVVE